MNFLFFHSAPKDLKHQSIEQITPRAHEHPHNTYEGSEFLDDAIRMKDQPLMYTEENISPQSRALFLSLNRIF